MDVVPIVCHNCGKEKIYFPPWRHNEIVNRPNTKNNFCSRSCVSKWYNKVDNPMKRLEVRKKVSQTMSDGRNKGKNNPNYKDGRSFYSKFRKKECERCGARRNINTKKPLYVHHKDGDRTNADPQNLQTVCASCHEKIHKRWER